jgi:hypothetical protein
MTICARHPEAFGEPLATNDARRLDLLQTVIVPTLNEVDDGHWGVLTKTDQGNKVPCDVIVWQPTREHFDVMTGTGGAWIPHGPVTNPAWAWTNVAPSVIGNAPPPTPVVVPPLVASADLTPLLVRLDNLERDATQTHQQLEQLRFDLERWKRRKLYATFWGIRIPCVPDERDPPDF